MRICLVVIGLGLLVGCSGPALRPADRWVARHGGVFDSPGGRIERIATRFDGLLTRPIRLIVMDRDALAAYSFPSGEVIVTRGLVAAMNDDELTAVVGHEVGHLLSDGHTAAPTALTGRRTATDREHAADDAAVRLLTALSLPAESMRSALQKVHASLPADSPTRASLARRIDRLAR